MIPDLSLHNNLYYLNLRSNQFQGHIPSFLRGSMYLDLSNNKFTYYFVATLFRPLKFILVVHTLSSSMVFS